MTQIAEKVHGDIDPQETQEWIDSLRAVIDREGPVYYTHLTMPTKEVW